MQSTQLITEKCVLYLVIHLYSGLEHLLSSLDVQQNVGERPNSILVSPHHKVRKTNIVKRGDLAGRYSRIHALKSYFNTPLDIVIRKDKNLDFNISINLKLKTWMPFFVLCYPLWLNVLELFGLTISHLLVEVNTLQDLEGLVVIPQQGVES